MVTKQKLIQYLTSDQIDALMKITGVKTIHNRRLAPLFAAIVKKHYKLIGEPPNIKLWSNFYFYQSEPHYTTIDNETYIKLTVLAAQFNMGINKLLYCIAKGIIVCTND